MSLDVPITGPANSLRRDVASAYLATGSRVAAWVLVSAILFRRGGAGQFAMFALVRSTVGLLNYTSFGLAPAMIRMLAEARHEPAPASAHDADSSFAARIYANGMILALVGCAIGLALTIAYGGLFSFLHTVPAQLKTSMPALVLLMGVGNLSRLLSDPASAELQTRRFIARDNFLVSASEAVFALLALAASWPLQPLLAAGGAFCISGLMLLVARLAQVQRIAGGGRARWGLMNVPLLRRLLGLGLVVVIANLADYLYAPTDFILINRLIDAKTVADYAPATQIDSGMLLLVSALAAVLLPRAALAHVAGNRAAVRRYYIRGTLASLALLVPAALAVYALAPILFRLWLGNPMPLTCAILPLVLIHTVAGGSAIVGRSILLGMGKFKPFTAAVLIAGVANVILSYAFVRFGHQGLRGIVLGTIAAVVGRCAIWMPWYVGRTISE